MKDIIAIIALIGIFTVPVVIALLDAHRFTTRMVTIQYQHLLTMYGSPDGSRWAWAEGYYDAPTPEAALRAYPMRRVVPAFWHRRVVEQVIARGSVGHQRRAHRAGEGLV